MIAVKNLKYDQVDINNTFIKIFLKYNIYMSLSKRYSVLENIIFKIKKNLYGLKQTAKN